MLKNLVQKRKNNNASGKYPSNISKNNPISTNSRVYPKINTSATLVYDTTPTWELNIYNNENTYNVCIDTYKNKNDSILYGTPYFITQFTGSIQIGNGININSYNPASNPKSALAGTNITIDNSLNKIYNTNLIFQYDGIADYYQYAQIKTLSDGSFIIIFAFLQNITYYDGHDFIILSNTGTDENSGIKYNYLMARITPVLQSSITNNGWATVNWIKKIYTTEITDNNTSSSLGIPDLYIDVDNNNNNIYMIGSYNGNLRFDPVDDITPPQTNLNSDMFIAKFDSNGILIWCKSSLKDNIASNQISAGDIRGYSLALNNNANESINDTYFIVIGGYNDTLSLETMISENENIISTVYNDQIAENMWIAKFDTNGNNLWLINAGSDYNINDNIPADSQYLTGFQIIHSENNSYYISGDYVGNYTFNQNNSSKEISIYNQVDTPKIFITNLNDIVFDWVKSITSYVPNYISHFPHMTYINSKIYINFFGIFSAVYHISNIPSTSDIIIHGSGSLDNYINLIDINGLWGTNPVSQKGTIQNSSINTVNGPPENNTDPYYLIGTHNVGYDGSNGFLIKY